MVADFSPTTPQEPSLLVSVVNRFGAHALAPMVVTITAFAGLDQTQAGQLTQILLACLAAAVAWGWNEFQSYLHRKNAKARVVQAAVTGKVS